MGEKKGAGEGGNLGRGGVQVNISTWETSGDGCCASAHHLPVAMETDSQSNMEGNAGFRVRCVHMLLHANNCMTGHVCDTSMCVFTCYIYTNTWARG